jgi:hypothetical protein
MKVKNTLRMQAMLLAFVGAVLLMGTSVYAQEIENTVWNDSQNVAALDQPARAATVADTKATKPATPPTSEATDIQGMNAAAVIQPNVSQATGASQWTYAEVWVMLSSFVFIAAIMLYALVEARHANRRFNTSVVRTKSWTTLS